MDIEPAALLSRYFLPTDPNPRRFVYDLPPTWWSRGMEYSWAARFAQPGQVALDAGCGLAHPFKFYLAGICQEVHALDRDPRIADPLALRQAVVDDAGPRALADIAPAAWTLLRLRQGDLTALPYQDASFDAVFCISTLEHLAVGDQAAALTEMGRVLKPTGVLVMTVDVPPADPAYLHALLPRAGLAFYGPVDFYRPPQAVFATPWGALACFRALLTPDPGPRGRSPA